MSSLSQSDITIEEIMKSDREDEKAYIKKLKKMTKSRLIIELLEWKFM
jgi:hypothetical protein